MTCHVSLSRASAKCAVLALLSFWGTQCFHSQVLSSLRGAATQPSASSPRQNGTWGLFHKVPTWKTSCRVKPAGFCRLVMMCWRVQQKPDKWLAAGQWQLKLAEPTSAAEVRDEILKMRDKGLLLNHHIRSLEVHCDLLAWLGQENLAKNEEREQWTSPEKKPFIM